VTHKQTCQVYSDKIEMTGQGVTQGGKRDVDGAAAASGFHYPTETMLLRSGAMKGRAATF